MYSPTNMKMLHDLSNFYGYHNTDWFNDVLLAAIFIYLFLDLIDFCLTHHRSSIIDNCVLLCLLITESIIFRIVLRNQDMFSIHFINGRAGELR